MARRRERWRVLGVVALLMGLGAWAQSGRSRAEMGPEGTGPASPGAGGSVTVASAHTAGRLRMFFADVEGGQAVLVVTPAGRSLLIDAGSPAFGGRDADRIVALARRAGVKRIDLMLVTQFGADHAGGVGELLRRIPVRRFLDYGEMAGAVKGEAGGASGEAATPYVAYRRTLRERKIPRTAVKVGDILPIPGVRVQVVSAGGAVLTAPLTGGGAGGENAACAGSPERTPAGGEGDRSVGLMLTFGAVRVLDLGDLSWGMERSLVCPVDRLGRVDVFVVSDHGRAESNSPALLAAVRPRLAIIENGARRGGEPAVLRSLEDPASGVGALWQMHAAEGVGPELNTAQERMANRAGEEGSWLEVDAGADGSLEVTNGRTGEVTGYARGAQPHRI